MSKAPAFLGGVALLTVLSIGVAGCGDQALPVEPIDGPGDYVRTFESAGRTREYEVHVPPTYEPSQPAPVVLVFHGAPRGVGMRVITGFDEKADEEGFIVVYPRAWDSREWAVGCSLCTTAERAGVDDLRYVRDVIRKMSLDLEIDLDRVYATGFSQGALFTLRLACGLSDEIAAFAPVSATMLEPVAERCAPSRPVPLQLILGTEDDQFPWEGRSSDLANSLGAEESIQTFVGIDGCSQVPTVTQLPDIDPDDETTVRLEEYPGCDPGSEVSFYVVENGGHTWPDAPVEFSPDAGPKTRDINANELISAFFKRHALGGGASGAGATDGG
jgi:polyhydroxybutyrate depolymerase